jgi:hemerythrin-like domain-containing protein
MNLVDILIGEHDVLLQLLGAVEEHASVYLTGNAAVDECRLVTELVVDHAAKEDELLFTALEPRIKDYGPLVVSEHRAQHREIERLFRQALQLGAESREASLAASTFTRKHFEQEERILFPLARRALSAEELETLGRKAQSFRERRPRGI